MRKQNQVGSTSVIFAILFGVLFAAAAGFGGWAFMGRQDYKNNSDKKSAAAVESATKTQAADLQKKFDEDYKNPNKTYQGSISFGTVTFNYPKTWSAYVDENTSSTPINGYFYPDKVPSTQSGSAYALRVELLNSSYTQIIRQFDSQVKQGKLRASAYVPPKMVGVANVQPGTKFDGVVSQNQTGPHTGSMVVVQVRDKTLKIYTESNNFLPDYNNIVLPSLTYVP
jgi:Flp pilus assembly protein TadG